MHAGYDQNAIIAELHQLRDRIIQAKTGGQDVSLAEQTFRNAQPAFQSGDMAAVATILQQVRMQLDGGALPQAAPAQTASQSRGATKEQAMAELGKAKEAIVALKGKGLDTAQAEQMFAGAEPFVRSGDFGGAFDIGVKVNQFVARMDAQAQAPAQAPPAGEADAKSRAMARLGAAKEKIMALRKAGIDTTVLENEFKTAEPVLRGGNFQGVLGIAERILEMAAGMEAQPPAQEAPVPVPPAPEAPAPQPPAPEAPAPEPPAPEAPAPEPPAPEAPAPEPAEQEAPAPESPERPVEFEPGELSPVEVQTKATILFMSAQTRMMAVRSQGGDTAPFQSWLKRAAPSFAQKDFGAVLALEGELPPEY